MYSRLSLVRPGRDLNQDNSSGVGLMWLERFATSLFPALCTDVQLYLVYEATNLRHQGYA